MTSDLATHPARVLIIDDEKAIRDSFAAHLEDYGYSILTAENGRVGLEVFACEHPDLVLVDLRMPEVDGIQVLQQLSRLSPLTPLVVVSGTGIITDAIEALHCGAWDYLLKPVADLSLLLHAVQASLEKAHLKAENRAYRERLEELVTQRTAQLEEANRNLSQINSRLRHIVDTTRALGFCKEVESFGSQLLEEFGQHMLASGGSLYLKEAEGLRLVHSLDSGHAADFIPFPLKENSLFQKSISAKEPMLVQKISGDKDIQPSGWQGYPDGSALIFPMPDEFGDIAGIMTLHSKTPPPFMEQDREIGTILAHYSCEALRAVRATEELQKSESRFRKILDTIPIGIVIVEAAGFAVVYMNPTAAKMSGIDSQDIIGRVSEVFSPNSHADSAIFTKETTTPMHDTLLTEGGQILPILKTVSRTSLTGKECILYSFTDLSAQVQAEQENKKLEVQLRQAQKMEALGTLAGGIAHDFNNILSAVLGYSELALRDIQDQSNPLFMKIQAINNAGHRAKDLVDQILAFSRMKEQLKAPIAIASIIREALKLLKTSLPANIEVQMDLQTEMFVLADPTQIHQVVMNLCTNAYHAMQESGGILGVRMEEWTIEKSAEEESLTLQPGKYLRLTVSDTGHGIDMHIIDKIFDPYFTTKEKGKGTGLGLSMVHGIVKRHDGIIKVESRKGKGTKFIILLPTTEHSLGLVGEEMAGLPRGSEHVLLVDDEGPLVDIGSEMLTRLGYQVTGIVGSISALEAFQLNPMLYDIVVTDFNMPGLTGDKLAQHILAERRDMPIIVCTGYSEIFDQHRAETLGIRKVLMKPLSMETMAFAVCDVLAARSY